MDRDRDDPLYISSDELAGMSEDEEENPTGFLYGHMLDTYRRHKKERIAE